MRQNVTTLIRRHATVAHRRAQSLRIFLLMLLQFC
jgi:hypothetical protein